MALTETKHVKYYNMVQTWQHSREHNLKKMESLYGKLLHASLVIPTGQAYLMTLEFMLARVFHNKLFVPCTLPRSLPRELNWWLHELEIQPPKLYAIPEWQAYLNIEVYSDASSTVGIGIIIGER